MSEIIDYGCCRHEAESKDMCCCGCEHTPVPSTDVFIQWKGTDVCMDVTCACGRNDHIHGWFAYYLKCLGCGAVYKMPETFKLQRCDPKDAPEAATKEIGDADG